MRLPTWVVRIRSLLRFIFLLPGGDHGTGHDACRNWPGTPSRRDLPAAKIIARTATARAANGAIFPGAAARVPRSRSKAGTAGRAAGAPGAGPGDGGRIHRQRSL